MEGDGIPLFSKEGMGFVAMGIGLIAIFYVLNAAAKKDSKTGPTETIGVRG